MRKVPLYTEPPAIMAEMHRLWQAGTDLLFRRPQATPKFLRLLELRGDMEPARLLVAKTTPFMAQCRSGWFFYRIDGEGAVFTGKWRPRIRTT